MSSKKGFQATAPCGTGCGWGLIFAFMTYFVVHDKGGTLSKAVLMSAIVTVFAHFFLRWGMTRGLWDGLQTWAWLRKE